MTFAALMESEFVLPPFDHQLAEFEKHSDTPARALAWTMRTGKTKEEIDKACHLYKNRSKIDAVLIFAPNGVHANWVEVEWPKHCWPGIKTDALIWRSSELSAKRRNTIAKKDAAAFEADRKEWWKKLRTARHTPNLIVLAIPTESMTRKDVRTVVGYLLKKRRVFVIFDESDDFGVPGSKRTKMARALARHTKARTILSGTMLTGSPLAAYSQFELLERNALGFPDYAAFKDHYCDVELTRGKGGKTYPKIVGFKNQDDLRARMAPFMSVVRREDVKDMPALNIEPRHFEATAEQLRVYRELNKKITTQIRNREVSIGELAPKLQKLQQVFSGFVIDEFKDIHRIPGGNPRLDLMLHETFIAPGKVVIWCHFQEDIDFVCAALRLEGYEVAEYHGRVSDKAKAKSLSNFRTNRDFKALVGHAQSCGRGQDFAVASSIFVYSHSFKARMREQMLERASKIGGGNIQVLDFVGPGPDQYILDVTEGRIQMNDSLTGEGMKELLRSLSL